MTANGDPRQFYKECFGESLFTCTVMEPPEINNDIEDLLFGVTTLQISTLKHAAELSPMVSCCTLGPNSVFNRELKEKCENTHDIMNKENVNLSKNNSGKENNDISNQSHNCGYKTPPTKKTVDIRALNCNAILRSMEKLRKDEIKKELDHRQSILREEGKKRLETQQKCINEQKRLIACNIDDHKQIVEEVEYFVKAASEENAKYFDNLRRGENEKLHRITFEVIIVYQKSFKAVYDKIIKLLPTIDKKKFTKMEEYNKLIKVLILNYENLKQKVRSEEIGPAEVKFAGNLLTNIEMIYEKLSQEAERMSRESKQQEEQQKQQEIARNNAASTTPSTPIQPAEVPVPDKGFTVTDAPQAEKTVSGNAELLASFISSDRFEFYREIMKFYSTKLENYNRLMVDESMKKQRAAWQKAINIPVNTISAVSPQHLQQFEDNIGRFPLVRLRRYKNTTFDDSSAVMFSTPRYDPICLIRHKCYRKYALLKLLLNAYKSNIDKFDRIYNFIAGNAPRTPENPLSPLEHPLGKDFCLVLLAKKLVSQGETTVSSNAQAAFAIAAVIVALWQKVADFGKLFLACIYEDCPYLVPYFIPQFKGQSIDDYFRILGYRFVDDALEKQDMYLKRQTGITRLFSAVIITQAKQQFGPHPYGIENGWKWLCDILNLEPLPDICATVIGEFLQTAGATLLRNYGLQFSKLLLLMQGQYIPKLTRVDEGGPKARLEVFLSKVLREGRIEEPSGILPPNFW